MLWCTASTFADNWAGRGGAIAAEDAEVRIERTEFRRNQGGSEFLGGSSGGALDLADCRYEIADSRFLDNRSYNEHDRTGMGGAICLWQGSGRIGGCLFARNLAAEQGGAIRSTGDPAIEGSTFFANGDATFLPHFNGAHVLVAGGRPTFRRSIFAYGVRGSDIACTGLWSLIGLDCCDFWASGAGSGSCITTGTGNFLADPRFCDPAADDFRLRANSPCAPENAPGCGLIGAYGVGCGAEVVAPSTWGAIKAQYHPRRAPQADSGH